MKTLFFVLSLFLTIQLAGQETAKQTYESTNMKKDIDKHKIVAILPFNATIS